MCPLPNQGFILAEDAALKSRLVNGLYVSDDKDDKRPIQVFYRYPESEKERSYPFATIELIGISHARGRQESEVTYYYPSSQSASATTSPTIDYFPSEYGETDLTSVAGSSDYLKTEQMNPIDLTYQISTYCRSQRHDRQLTSAMLRYIFPMRWSYIEIPEDGTSRRCDFLGWRSADVLDQEAGYKKRIFRKVYTVQINSELPSSELESVAKVLDVVGNISTIDPSPYTSLSENLIT